MSKELIKSFTALEEQKGIKQEEIVDAIKAALIAACLLYTSPSPRDAHESRMPSSA